jgi:hypothetical protein
MGFATALCSSTRYETLASGAGSGSGVNVTSGTGAYGSLVTIGSPSFDYDGFFLSIVGANTGRQRITVTLNTGIADETLIGDYFADFSAGGSNNSAFVSFPVAVPAGATLKAQVWHNSGSGFGCYLAIVGFQGDARQIRGFRAALSATDFGSTQDPTNSITLSGTTTTGWVQSQATSPARFAALYASFDGKGNSIASARIKWDLGWGTSGSEHQLASYLAVYNGSNHSLAGPFPCDIPVGSRIVYRATCSASDTNVLALVLTGIAA